MLIEWKSKFPASFAAHPTVFTESGTFQSHLSSLLSMLDERRLLDEYMVSNVLVQSYHSLEDLIYLIKKLDELSCLSVPILREVLNKDLFVLTRCVRELSISTPTTAEMLTFILMANDPTSCVEFIKRALASKVGSDSIMYWLSHHVAMEGLHHALILFNLSGFEYHKDHFEQFSVLTSVLANPLCQTIFGARLRCFSDYQLEVREPVTGRMADEIIHWLHALPDEESRSRVFFNYFARFRVLPCSQKYIVDVDIASIVTSVLTSYCTQKINEISSPQDYLEVKQMIRTLKTIGGDKSIFDCIKYAVGSAIESEDMLSARSYEELMEQIWQALNRPQIDLDSVTERFERSPWHVRELAGVIRGVGLLSIAPVAASCVEVNDEVGAVARKPSGL